MNIQLYDPDKSQIEPFVIYMQLYACASYYGHTQCTELFLSYFSGKFDPLYSFHGITYYLFLGS